MTITLAGLDALEAKAKAATPGKRTVVEHTRDVWVDSEGDSICHMQPRGPHVSTRLNAAHIAAFDRETSVALIALARQTLERAAERCKWTENDEDDSFDAECGGKFTRDEHGSAKYCACCGRLVEVVPFVEEAEEADDE